MATMTQEIATAMAAIEETIRTRGCKDASGIRGTYVWNGAHSVLHGGQDWGSFVDDSVVRDYLMRHEPTLWAPLALATEGVTRPERVSSLDAFLAWCKKKDTMYAQLKDDSGVFFTPEHDELLYKVFGYRAETREELRFFANLLNGTVSVEPYWATTHRSSLGSEYQLVSFVYQDNNLVLHRLVAGWSMYHNPKAIVLYHTPETGYETLPTPSRDEAYESFCQMRDSYQRYSYGVPLSLWNHGDRRDEEIGQAFGSWPGKERFAWYWGLWGSCEGSIASPQSIIISVDNRRVMKFVAPGPRSIFRQVWA